MTASLTNSSEKSGYQRRGEAKKLNAYIWRTEIKHGVSSCVKVNTQWIGPYKPFHDRCCHTWKMFTAGFTHYCFSNLEILFQILSDGVWLWAARVLLDNSVFAGDKHMSWTMVTRL